jgi:cysteine sulfinate desulfinase/cysteine desulfurase-like protein
MGAIRFNLGRGTTEEDTDETVAMLKQALASNNNRD